MPLAVGKYLCHKVSTRRKGGNVLNRKVWRASPEGEVPEEKVFMRKSGQPVIQYISLRFFAGLSLLHKLCCSRNTGSNLLHDR
jgi:hypothetical protein